MRLRKMKFLSLTISGFRNIDDVSMNLDARHVIFIGENGQGKTNLLESLYLSCYGSSFRTRRTSQLIGFGKERAKITVRIQEQDAVHTVEALLQQGSISMNIDKKEISDRMELMNRFPCIVFTHEDIAFVKGAPQEKRRFFDQTMCLHDPLFLYDLRRYHRILKQRNQALKDQRLSLMPTYDEQLAHIGITIQQQRSKTAEEFNKLFPELFSRVSGMDDPPIMDYRPSWGSTATRDEVKKKLSDTLSRDLRFLTTTSGPHRDRFICKKGSADFSQTASTGQLRLISLALRAAQATYYKNKTGRLPVLLLDDVLLELDHGKRQRFIQELSGYEQAVCTFLPEEVYGHEQQFSDVLNYTVSKGNAYQ